jgi:hypothetical protein
MPVIVNEVVSQVTPEVTPSTSSESVQSATPVTAPEYEMLSMLNLINERQARLSID